jgi:hypothetical protein
MRLAYYLGILHQGQVRLAASLRALARAHPDETDVHFVAPRLAGQCERQVEALGRHLSRYGEDPAAEPATRFHGPHGGGLGLLRDLHDLYLMVAECDLCLTVVDRAAQGARDTELQADVERCHAENRVHLAWLRTQLAQSAVQVLVVT